MKLELELVIEAAARPVAGTPFRVQARDTSLADAPASVLAEFSGRLEPGTGPELARVTLTFETRGRSTLWAHVDVDGDGRVSRGDFVTTQSYPVPREARAPVRLTLKQV